SDLGADQYRENRRQGMDRQVTPHDPRRSEIVLNQSPSTQQYSHPDPVGVINDTNADNRGECAHPAECRNELQQSAQHCQGDGVRKSKEEQGRGIEDERKSTEKNLGPYVSSEHEVQFFGYAPDPQAPVRRKEYLD